MSSNIRIERICIFCKEKFIAKTFSTKYCSHKCNSRDYKIKFRERKIKNSTLTVTKVKDVSEVKIPTIEELEKKTYLTIKEVCLVFTLSHSTVRKFIKSGFIKTTRLGKKHFIHRSELEFI